MLFFTWNVARNEDATRLALDYLETAARTKRVMASLQELPPKRRIGRGATWKVPSFLDTSSLQSRGLQLWGPIGLGRVAILTNHGTAMDGPQWVDGNERMLGVPICENTKKLLVIGVHAVDRSNPEAQTDFQRGSHAALTRREIDEIWNSSRSLVLLGDWNVVPMAEEMTLREGLFSRAREGMKDVTARMKSHYGKSSPPLVNLMRELRDVDTEKSYFWQTRGEWYLFDQFIVSEDLELLAGTPVVKRDVSGTSLVTRSSMRRPNKALYSDHLPVEVDIAI